MTSDDSYTWASRAVAEKSSATCVATGYEIGYVARSFCVALSSAAWFEKL